jgi:hypothetical protein
MSMPASCNQGAGTLLNLMAHPACRAHCITRAENKVMAEAYDRARGATLSHAPQGWLPPGALPLAYITRTLQPSTTITL